MFKERLTTLRKQAGLTQSVLGRRLGVSATTIYKWEHGQCEPGIDSLNTMAQIFGVSVDTLCDRGDAPDGESSEAIVMNRAFRRMTAEERQKVLAVSRTLFAHAFEDGAE